MVHAHPDPRSFGSESTHNVPPSVQASQAATREAAIDAYIARVVAKAPKRSDAVLDHIAVLLRPRVERTNATPAISVKDWVKFENKRYVEATETPGIHGTYGDEVAA